MRATLSLALVALALHRASCANAFSAPDTSAAADEVSHLTKRSPDPPVWPSAFKVNFKFHVPFVARYQAGGPLEYDMKIWRDSEAGLQRIERDGSEVWMEHLKEDLRWYVSPGNQTLDGCLCENMSSGGSPSRRRMLDNSAAYKLMSHALPDMTESKWSFEDSRTIDTDNGQTDVDVFHYHASHDEGYGVVNIDWRLSVTPEGVPVRMDMWGINWFSGGHWDHYIADFYGYEAHPTFAKDTFKMPEVCTGVKPRDPDIPPLMGGHHLTARLHTARQGVLPPHYTGDEEYDGHVAKYGRAHAHQAEYDTRRDHYYANKATIAAHNRGGESTFTQALNRFADWGHEEYVALIQARRSVVDQAKAGKPDVKLHDSKLPMHMLPSTVDWRGSGADTPIKDQAMCGSCWAFAAVAPMETAYFRQYGEPKMLSEQYLMDCSWPFGNNGCNGGFQDKAFNFVIANGGLPSNEDYPYRGVNMACRNGTHKSAAFSSSVAVTPYDGEQLKEALLTKGPMTVSLDAASPAFKFYKEGIYFNPECTMRPPELLDHAVMISGYGRCPKTGRNYWILKNIWSTYWGEDGYMRMDMDENDCGVTAMAQYVELDAAATDRLNAENA